MECTQCHLGDWYSLPVVRPLSPGRCVCGGCCRTQHSAGCSCKCPAQSHPSGHTLLLAQGNMASENLTASHRRMARYLCLSTQLHWVPFCSISQWSRPILSAEQTPVVTSNEPAVSNVSYSIAIPKSPPCGSPKPEEWRASHLLAFALFPESAAEWL